MVSIIVGMTRKRVIGKNNELPWHISEDLKNFKRLTNNSTVIMGRKTYDSIKQTLGKPLPNRDNIVISRSMEPEEGISIARSMEEAVTIAKRNNNEIFIIGGAQIYREALPFATKMYISYVREDYDGDTYFPEWNKEEWEVINEEEFEHFIFMIYQRKTNKK